MGGHTWTHSSHARSSRGRGMLEVNLISAFHRTKGPQTGALVALTHCCTTPATWRQPKFMAFVHRSGRTHRPGCERNWGLRSHMPLCHCVSSLLQKEEIKCNSRHRVPTNLCSGLVSYYQCDFPEKKWFPFSDRTTTHSLLRAWDLPLLHHRFTQHWASLLLCSALIWQTLKINSKIKQ